MTKAQFDEWHEMIAKEDPLWVLNLYIPRHKPTPKELEKAQKVFNAALEMEFVDCVWDGDNFIRQDTGKPLRD